MKHCVSSALFINLFSWSGKAGQKKVQRDSSFEFYERSILSPDVECCLHVNPALSAMLCHVDNDRIGTLIALESYKHCVTVGFASEEYPEGNEQRLKFKLIFRKCTPQNKISL